MIAQMLLVKEDTVIQKLEVVNRCPNKFYDVGIGSVKRMFKLS